MNTARDIINQVNGRLRDARVAGAGDARLLVVLATVVGEVRNVCMQVAPQALETPLVSTVTYPAGERWVSLETLASALVDARMLRIEEAGEIHEINEWTTSLARRGGTAYALLGGALLGRIPVPETDVALRVVYVPAPPGAYTLDSLVPVPAEAVPYVVRAMVDAVVEFDEQVPQTTRDRSAVRLNQMRDDLELALTARNARGGLGADPGRVPEYPS